MRLVPVHSGASLAASDLLPVRRCRLCCRYVDLDSDSVLIEEDDRKGKKLRFCVQTQGRELWLEANSKSGKADWLAVIRAVISGADLDIE